MDEFHFSTHSFATYNWSPRSHPSIQAVNSNCWIMSFIIAVSEAKIEGVLASTKSINKMLFMKFLKDIWTQKQKVEKGKKVFALFLIILKYIAAATQKLYDKTRNKVNYYSTLLTPAQSGRKVIGVIKKKLKDEWMNEWMDGQQIIKYAGIHENYWWDFSRNMKKMNIFK